MSAANYFIADTDNQSYEDGSANSTANNQGWVLIKGSTLRMKESRTPASSTASGLKGEVCYDSSYLYVCTATDTWKRVAISGSGW